MTRVASGAVAGLCVMTGFPPYEWTIVSWAGMAGLVWLLATSPSARAARWTAYVYGLSFFGTLLSWLAEVELLAVYPLVMLEALPMLIVGSAVYRYRDASPFVFVLVAAGSMGLAEYVRVRWPYGGFPWGAPGLTVSGTPFRPSAQWIGASGWTVVLIGLAALVVLVVRRRVSVKALAIAALGMLALGFAGNLWPAIPQGASRVATIVQGNSPCPGARCPNERILIYESHLALTQTIDPGTTDLVVWPESSTGAVTDPVQHPAIGEAIGIEAARIGAAMIVGGDRDAGPENFINANVIFDSTGSMIGEYRKRHPVPFGEYVPLRPLLEWIPALDRVPRDMIRGVDPVLIDLGGVPLATVISYEGAFARYEREAVADGARLLVVATNEASFGDTPSSDQFIAISRLRAAEFGLDIVHAAVTGRSAFVLADGSVIDRTGLYQTGMITGTVHARSAGLTLYARWGDWFQVTVMLGYLSLRVRGRLEQLAIPNRSSLDH